MRALRFYMNNHDCRYDIIKNRNLSRINKEEI